MGPRMLAQLSYFIVFAASFVFMFLLLFTISSTKQQAPPRLVTGLPSFAAVEDGRNEYENWTREQRDIDAAAQKEQCCSVADAPIAMPHALCFTDTQRF